MTLALDDEWVSHATLRVSKDQTKEAEEGQGRRKHTGKEQRYLNNRREAWSDCT